jgi:hypothetical protein
LKKHALYEAPLSQQKLLFTIPKAEVKFFFFFNVEFFFFKLKEGYLEKLGGGVYGKLSTVMNTVNQVKKKIFNIFLDSIFGTQGLGRAGPLNWKPKYFVINDGILFKYESKVGKKFFFLKKNNSIFRDTHIQKNFHCIKQN